MSRAFVKDDDDRPEAEIDRPVSEHPNYVTPRGLRLLREALAAARASDNQREIRYYEGRVAGAIEIDTASQARDVVAFGATVAARTLDGTPMRVTIVGEDEAEPASGSISFISPFAQALLGHRVGETVIVQRPAGAVKLTIESIEYQSS